MSRKPWLAAITVTAAACGARPPADLGPLHTSQGDGDKTHHVTIAAAQNADGITSFRAGNYAWASDRFWTAAASVPLPHAMNLCISRYREGKLAEAKAACRVIGQIPGASPELRAQAERAIARIEADGKRRHIDTDHIPCDRSRPDCSERP